MSTWDDKPNDYEHALQIIERLRAALRMLIDNVDSGSYESTGQAADEVRALLSSQQEPVATGGVVLAVLRGQVLLLKAENEQLRARVEQLEAALVAVALKQPVGCDEKGHLVALPVRGGHST